MLAGPIESDSWDQETWADDLDRAVVLLSRQNFPAATTLIDRWLNHCTRERLNPRGLYLHARSLVLLGDARRDQGALSGPLSAKPCYSKAHSIFADLDIPRRAAQVELFLAVLTEMSGDLQQSARAYLHLSSDERLSRRDQARALLWVGTALSKDGDHCAAAEAITHAAQKFEEVSEPEDWAVAQQKLALAHRGLGDLTRAWHHLGQATSGASDTPLQQVRVRTARAHILLSHAATWTEGLSILDAAAATADASGLTHQVRSIQAIRQAAI